MNYCKSIQTRFFFFGIILLLTTQINGQRFTTIKSKEGIEIQEKGKKVLFYQVSQKSINGKFARAGYIHPLYSLNEKSLTDDMPKDHPYHHGIFWAWHQIILKNKKIAEGWSSENITWNPTNVSVHRNKKSATLQSEVLWRSAIDNKPTDIIRENTKIKVHELTGEYRIIDFDIRLYALVDSLKIGGSEDEKGYGGFCLRLKLPGDISFVSQNNIVIPQETQVIAGPWMDITGSFEGPSFPKSGILVFTNSGSSQQPWILRKVTSMQNVPYPGRTPIELTKKGLEFKYRVIVHNGEINYKDIEKLYKNYIGENE